MIYLVIILCAEFLLYIIGLLRMPVIVLHGTGAGRFKSGDRVMLK